MRKTLTVSPRYHRLDRGAATTAGRTIKTRRPMASTEASLSDAGRNDEAAIARAMEERRMREENAMEEILRWQELEEEVIREIMAEREFLQRRGSEGLWSARPGIGIGISISLACLIFDVDCTFRQQNQC